jgi:hypothetical protein
MGFGGLPCGLWPEGGLFARCQVCQLPTGRPVCPSLPRSKHVAFPPRLRMKRGWLAADCGERGAAPEYELVSTVTHHGKAISSGHYTADVRQPGGK